MKTFHCACGNRIYFENTQCQACGRVLGYLPDRHIVSALIQEQDGANWTAITPDGALGAYRKCAHYEFQNCCNWMVSADDPDAYCRACRLNSIIPDLSVPENRKFWFRIERAKRRLVYTLDMLGLPVFGKAVDPGRGLAFQFLRDAESDLGEFIADLDDSHRILTGHGDGMITINIAEADAPARELMRERMNEAYRTLLGHFRHESGHYYWDLLVRDSAWLEPVRTLFGDERQDYQPALAAYYANGPVQDWPYDHVSAYASAHPWEDWAETWAHYMHMVDTLETAVDMRLSIDSHPVVEWRPGDEASLDSVLRGWSALTTALNALNRSMGQPDAYPFSIGLGANEKLRLIDRIIVDWRRAARPYPLPIQSAAARKAPA